MTAQSTPAVPPRPSRSPNPSSPPKDLPRVPPRPIARRYEKSVSPVRDSYAPSPLNILPNGSPPKQRSVPKPLLEEHSQRPPSVTIPSLGEEGREYEDIDVGNVSDNHSPDIHTVASDLHLYAPMPSLPQSSATAKMQAVTHTDSSHASVAGISKPASPEVSRPGTSRNRISYSESLPSSSERRSSQQLADEHGIPEIGQRVPMYPNAGDVQAPSVPPSENDSIHRGRRHHNRTRSGRDPSLPPGSYGLHGHGVNTNDRFERAWYQKHPDEFAKEEHQFPPGLGVRPDSALSSDALNKIVRSSATTGSGLGRLNSCNVLSFYTFVACVLTRPQVLLQRSLVPQRRRLDTLLRRNMLLVWLPQH